MKELFNSEFLYRAVSIVSALLSFFVGGLLLNIRSRLKDMKETLPNDLIPYKHMNARMILGIAYLTVGTVTLARISVLSEMNMEAMFPNENLVLGTAQIFLTTTALLSLYNAPSVNAGFLTANVSAFIVLTVFYAIFDESSAVYEMIRYAWMAFYIFQIAACAVVFIFERCRYMRTMTESFGPDQARDYRKAGSVVLMVFAILLSLWMSAIRFFPSIGYVTMFITVYTIYYTALGIYFHNQLKDSAVVQEITLK